MTKYWLKPLKVKNTAFLQTLQKISFFLLLFLKKSYFWESAYRLVIYIKSTFVHFTFVLLNLKCKKIVWLIQTQNGFQIFTFFGNFRTFFPICDFFICRFRHYGRKIQFFGRKFKFLTVKNNYKEKYWILKYYYLFFFKVVNFKNILIFFWIFSKNLRKLRIVVLKFSLWNVFNV